LTDHALLGEKGEYPTGREMVDRFFRLFADMEQIKYHLQLNTHVLAVSRVGEDAMKTKGRSAALFLLRVSV
jgi:outer membrane protein assembly factor BamD (BamD/ComL family)